MRAPIEVSFTTSSLPLLDAIFRDQGAGAGIPFLTLSIRAGGHGRPFALALTHTFSRVSVGSLAENISESLVGTATLVVRPR